MNLLDRIMADKRREIELRKAALSMRELEQRIASAARPADFLTALRASPMGLIAEVKRRSPSAGLIRTPFDPAEIASAYASGGAHAISVLMDGPYFGGGEEDFMTVRRAVNVPLLYKEFVLDPWQVMHARALGASAVLLIVAALPAKTLAVLHREIERVGLTPLVEVHDQREMKQACDLGAPCIGINNRNLKTFETTLATTFELAPLAPRECLLVSESGIRTARDVEHVRRAGARAVLVGESLLRKRDLARAVKSLMEKSWAVV